MNTYHEILAAMNTLSPQERAKLLDAFWENADSDDWGPLSDAWKVESNRRSDAIDSGEMTVEEWSVVRKRAAKKAGLDG